MRKLNVAAVVRSEEVLSLALLTAALLACGGSVKKVTAADGRDAVRIKCNRDRANCLDEASNSCKTAGYHVLDEESHSGGVAADILPGPVPWWTMTVRCGQPPAGYVAPAAAAPSVTPLPTVATMPAPQSPPAYQPVEPYASQQKAHGSSGCASDYECSYGQKCVKDSLAYRGVCAQPVNPNGLPQVSPPSGGSLGAGTGNCQFDTQCAIGFKCVKPSGGLYGNCMK